MYITTLNCTVVFVPEQHILINGKDVHDVMEGESLFLESRLFCCCIRSLEGGDTY